jgi:uncharacterized protein
MWPRAERVRADRRAPRGTVTPSPHHPQRKFLGRLLYSGIEALNTGAIRIDVAEQRQELLAIKSGALSFEQAKAKALELDQQFQEAYRETKLPEQPDYRRADEFLIWARRRMVDA